MLMKHSGVSGGQRKCNLIPVGSWQAGGLRCLQEALSPHKYGVL